MSIGFTEVGGTGFNLTSINLNVASCYGDIYIEMLDSLGRTTDTYYWYKNAGFRADGWYNDDGDQIGEDVDDVVFAPGQGLWLTGIDGETFTAAGKVYQADSSIPLLDDSQMLGNPYAAPIGLAENIEIETTACFGDIYIEMLDSLGRTTDTYYWYKNAGFRADGWYNDDGDQIGEDVDDVVFPAGQGLWVNGVEDTNFNITSPIPAN